MKKIIPIVRAETLIPKGMYCYEGLRDTQYDEKGIPFWPVLNLCPFWSIDNTQEEQNNGVCWYTKLKDSEDGTLLWDQVKGCRVNYDEEI